MVSGPDEDFANFLEFGDLQLNFPHFDGVPQNEAQIQENVDVAMDTTMGDGTDLSGYHDAQANQQLNHSTSNPLLNGYGGSHEQLFDMQMPTHLNQPSHAYSKGPQYTQGMVPPTPNSIEMHGGHPTYYHLSTHQQAHVYDHYRRNHRDQVRAMRCEINSTTG